MSATEDIQTLKELKNNQVVSNELKQILIEVLNLSKIRKPNYIDVGKTSGSAVRKYKNKVFSTYDIKYQISQGDERERIGNLVHELTHACVQEAFDADFFNYSTPQSELGNVPDTEFHEGGTYLSNEEARQTSRLHMDYLQVIIKRLQKLKKLAKISEHLRKDYHETVTTKIDYGIMNPQKEYDTVINQILVWTHYWNIRGGNFMRELVKIVKENYKSRRNKIRMPVGQKQKKCYLTTACVMSIGLKDDCNELNTLRRFRDEYLQNQPEGNRLIDEYYGIAPSIVDKINFRKDAASIYNSIYKDVILPCVDAINARQYDEALARYKDMFNKLLHL